MLSWMAISLLKQVVLVIMDNIKTQITSHYLHIERMMSETIRIIRFCSKPIAITAKVMRVVVGDYLRHLNTTT
jgi:hypothetical protein